MSLNEKLIEIKEEYKGKIKFLRLTGEKHFGPYSNSAVPMILIGMENNENKLIKCKIPMDAFGLPNDGYSVTLLEKA